MTTIRPAELEDLDVCLTLDHSCITEYVWQMDVQEGNHGVTVGFRTVHLPRSVYVPYPRDREALLSGWYHHDCFLIATQGDGKQETAASSAETESRDPIIGYLTMEEQKWHQTGWVADLVVAPGNRRRGIASRLLHAGKEWARQAGLRRLVIETQTKSYPAICFLERQGFAFCGFNDRYYTHQDIALFFALDLR